MDRLEKPPKIYATEGAAKSETSAVLAGTYTARSAWLYELHPSESTPPGTPTFLVSYSAQLRLYEHQWLKARHMTTTRLGRFRPDGSYFQVKDTRPRSVAQTALPAR